VTVVVSGFRETAAAFGRVNKQFPKDLRKELLRSAEPVRDDAQSLAGQMVRNLGSGDPWAQFRIGGGVKIVYIAPKQRGRRSRFDSRRRRPNLAPKLMEQAMIPALERNRDKVAALADEALQRMERDWGSGG
jgi:hypothetical protein